MKKGKLLGAIMALTLLGSTAAMADGYYYRDHNGNMVYSRAGDNYYRNHPTNQSFNKQRMHNRNRWVRGNRFPQEFRQNQYVVSDWQMRHLRAPPRGYRWYRSDDQYVLVRNSNGVIGDILNALR